MVTSDSLVSFIKERTHRARITAERVPFGEYNDCTVRATAIATGAEYGDAHDMWRTLGHRKHRTAAFWHHAGNIFDAMGYDLKTFAKPANVKTPITAAKFLPADGVFLLLTAHHVMCMRDGVVQDSFKEDRIRIYKVLECTSNAPAIMAQISDQLEMKLWR